MKNSYLASICFMVILMNACYMKTMPLMMKKDTVSHFFIQDTPFDLAFSKAAETVVERGMTITNSDKDNGSLYASYPVTMFGEMTNMNLVFVQESETLIKCTISLKSSKANKKAIDEFVAAYGKKVKISNEPS